MEQFIKAFATVEVLIVSISLIGGVVISIKGSVKEAIRMFVFMQLIIIFIFMLIGILSPLLNYIKNF